MRGLSQSNPQMRVGGSARRDTLGGRNGLTTQLSNVSEVTGQREYISLSTTQRYTEVADEQLLRVHATAHPRAR